MNQKQIITGLAFVLVIVLLIWFSGKGDKSTETVIEENQGVSGTSSQVSYQIPVRYFSPSSDKITINAVKKVLYINNPSTVLNYYALDSLNQPVHFREGDRAFVRILGITNLFTDNIEIFHPVNSDGSKDDTLFTGNISIVGEPGKYLVKVCIGSSINLDSQGTLIWPFGCFEDQTSEAIDVYAK